MILDPFFSDEVQLATSGARNLLFGPSGCLVEQNEDTLNSDLPAYESHIQDRIANYHVPTAPVSYQLNPWASANNTPFQTPFPSRPPSPSSLPRSSEDAESSEAYNPYFPRSTDQTFSAHDVSQRLLTGHRSGGQSRAETPSSAVPSTSQQPFAADLATTPTVPGLSSSSNSQQGSSGPSSVLSNSGGGHSLFNLHLPKSKSRRPFGGRHSSASPSTSGLATLGSREDPGQAPINPLSMPTTPMNMPQTAPTSPTRHDISLGANHQGPLSLPANPNLDNGEGPDFTNVPPYNVARDWLGGGVVPLSSMIGLPTYEESNSVPPSRVGSPTSQAPPPSTSQTSS